MRKTPTAISPEHNNLSSQPVPSFSSIKPSVLDFFSGSGLVTEALKPYFSVAWANDICQKKAAIYRANHQHHVFHLGSVDAVSGQDLPAAVLSWASFPCQDLSLAGNLKGIAATRSGLVWHWLRVMDEMSQRPTIVVAENVVGFVSAHSGNHYRQLHAALVARGYRVGALLLDAVHWTPQSRPRIFVVGVDSKVDISAVSTAGPSWPHPQSIQKVANGLPQWVWWSLPPPVQRTYALASLIDFQATCDEPERMRHNLDLIPAHHRERLANAILAGDTVFPGYKRTRNGHQVLELRFDNVAGCLRTPEGGSSRQLLVLARGDGELRTRLLTVPETARLMGAPKRYKIPGSYNDAYKAMGDAVSVPTVRYLARHLLAPLAEQR